MQKTINLNIDIHAELTGFGSAKNATSAHHKILKHYCSPFLFGPPKSDDMLELVTHMYTEDEADLVQHLPPLRPRTSEKVAKCSGRSVADVKRVLDNLAFTKVVLVAKGEPRKYTIMPIVPGTFEAALMATDLSTRNNWHKRFAELFEKLWDKGQFTLEYIPGTRPNVRYLPVNRVSKSLHMAWPSDKLEEILEPHDLFAVGHCQCRLAMELTNQGCRKPLENCVTFGNMAKPLISRNMMRKSSKQEVLEIKRHAEEHGCVTWMLNEMDAKKGNGSCSCCGCCCHALRTITQFNAPGLISKPHFLPQIDAQKCKLCKKCVKACPMGAWQDTENGLHFDMKRCIGCGLCMVACNFGAISLNPVDDVKPQEDSFVKLLLKTAPGYIFSSTKVWIRRTFLGDS